MSNLSQLHLKIGVHISPRISKLTSNATLADVLGTGRATKTGEFSGKFLTTFDPPQKKAKLFCVR